MNGYLIHIEWLSLLGGNMNGHGVKTNLMSTDRDSANRLHGVIRLINKDKSEYYRNLISENSNDSRKLWQALRKALHTVPETILPTHKCDKSLADRFASFFCEKIQKLRDLVSSYRVGFCFTMHGSS